MLPLPPWQGAKQGGTDRPELATRYLNFLLRSPVLSWQVDGVGVDLSDGGICYTHSCWADDCNFAAHDLGTDGNGRT